MGCARGTGRPRGTKGCPRVSAPCGAPPLRHPPQNGRRWPPAPARRLRHEWRRGLATRCAARFNGDHKTLDAKYPFHLWRVGDYIADIYEFTLEPNFTPGRYHVYYGLFMGARRLEVKRGRHDEDRLDAGSLEVR